MMAKRGRPRHPGILTPREWEVLALLREGLTNEQIAERLEITERTARYHVSEILSKLGVSTRQEAAAWEPGPQDERRRWWAVVPWLSLKKGWLAAALGTTVVAGALAGGGSSLGECSVLKVAGRTSIPKRPRGNKRPQTRIRSWQMLLEMLKRLRLARWLRESMVSISLDGG